MSAQQIRECLEPLDAGGVEPAFTLDGLHDDGGGLVHTGAGGFQAPLQREKVGDIAVEVFFGGNLG